MAPFRLLRGGSRQVCSAASHSGDVEALSTTVSKRASRRLWASPMLPLEAVAVTSSVQRAIQVVVKRAKLSLSDLGHAALPSNNFSGVPDARGQAQDDVNKVRPNIRRRGPLTSSSSPSVFSFENRELAAAVTSAPLSLASNVHVMSELRRCRPFAKPTSMLDFGAGSAASTSAAARVFRENMPDKADIGRETTNGLVSLGHDEENLLASFDSPDGQRAWERRGRAQLDWLPAGSTSLQRVVLVDQAAAMRKLGKEILSADEFVARSSRVDVKVFGSLRETRVPSFKDGFDIVSASFSLSEVFESLAAGVEVGVETETTPDEVDYRRLRRLKSTVLSLWKSVKPGGFLVILENGTLSGFETVLFARNVVLSHKQRVRNPKVADDLNVVDRTSQGIVSTKATVVAPCLHSHACPLESNKSKSRTCRFVQRLNRPPYLRIAKPSGNGFEDQHFSYTILEKTVSGNKTGDQVHIRTAEGNSPQIEQAFSPKETDGGWGRLVRAPLHRNKHILLDVCTSDAKLERRVVSKGNVEKEMYATARNARWGDVFPVAPPNAAQDVKF
jgi:ribosomal protein RSM22 (predicted rRNA methylase)